jgi:hypothetical protein
MMEIHIDQDSIVVVKVPPKTELFEKACQTIQFSQELSIDFISAALLLCDKKSYCFTSILHTLTPSFSSSTA